MPGIRDVEWTDCVSERQAYPRIHLALVFRISDGSPAFRVDHGCSAGCVLTTGALARHQTLQIPCCQAGLTLEAGPVSFSTNVPFIQRVLRTPRAFSSAPF